MLHHEAGPELATTRCRPGSFTQVLLRRQDLGAAKAAIEELFGKIGEIRRKAEASEVMVQEICRDIRKLDYAKTHLTHTITALRRLAMLVNAVGAPACQERCLGTYAVLCAPAWAALCQCTAPLLAQLPCFCLEPPGSNAQPYSGCCCFPVKAKGRAEAGVSGLTAWPC